MQKPREDRQVSGEAAAEINGVTAETIKMKIGKIGNDAKNSSTFLSCRFLCRLCRK